jgi:hypothetical protein
MADNIYYVNLIKPALGLLVIVGLFYQNTRINDMKDSLNKRIDDLGNHMGSEFRNVHKRIDDLSGHIDAEFRNVHQRIDRLEIPVGRK